jgi:hypothetical protein
MRAKTLKDGIKNLLNSNEDLKEKIFSHPLVKGICPKKGPGPSEIPARTFSLVLCDALMEAGSGQCQIPDRARWTYFRD